MPSLYPILLSIAIIGSLGVVYETYFAESVEDWFSELVERRREARRSRERKIRVEQGFEGNGGNENEGRKSWERERELDELVRREGLAAGKGQPGPFEEGENEEERLMRRSWSGFESGSAGGGLLPGGGDQVRRRTNSRLGSRGGSDDQLDFGTLLKPLPNPTSGTAPPPTHVLFTYSSPLPTPSALPPLPPLPPTTTTTISSPLTHISSSSSSSSSSASSSSSSASHSSIRSIHFPSASSSALSFASLSLASNLNSPLPSPSLLDRPPSTLVSTSWAHIPPSSSLHPLNPNDEGDDDARSQTLTLRSGSTGLLVSGSARGGGSFSDSTRSWEAGSVEEGWSARSSLDLGGSDVESVWSEGGFESVSAGGSLVGSSLGRGEAEDEEEEEEGWSDVGGGASEEGRGGR